MKRTSIETPTTRPELDLPSSADAPLDDHSVGDCPEKADDTEATDVPAPVDARPLCEDGDSAEHSAEVAGETAEDEEVKAVDDEMDNEDETEEADIAAVEEDSAKGEGGMG